LFALAYNLANFFRQRVLPKPIRGWTLTTLREKLIKIGAKVVAHATYVTFPLAEVAVPRQLFAQILERIARLCPPVPRVEVVRPNHRVRTPSLGVRGVPGERISGLHEREVSCAVDSGPDGAAPGGVFQGRIVATVPLGG
jgi:hypothetical protein